MVHVLQTLMILETMWLLCVYMITVLAENETRKSPRLP